jgi:putative aminopeptidase FrvX
LDTSPYDTIEAANEQLIVLREKDANAKFNEAATNKIQRLCEEAGISFMYKDKFVEQQNVKLEALGEKPKSIGSTEMGRIISASNGLVDGTTIQIPTTGYHTTAESASIESVAAFISLISKLALDET